MPHFSYYFSFVLYLPIELGLIAHCNFFLFNNFLLQVPQTSQDLAAQAKGMSRRAKQIRREIQLVEACRNCLIFPIEQYMFTIEKIRSGMGPSLRYFKCVFCSMCFFKPQHLCVILICLLTFTFFTHIFSFMQKSTLMQKFTLMLILFSSKKLTFFPIS